MGFTAAIVVGSALGGIASGAMSNKNAPDIPSAPEKPKVMSDSQMETNAKSRQDSARRQALAASGRSDTILTGGQGLGGSTTEQQNFQNMGKTLLGQ
jgi:hypothetical protein